MDVHKWWLPKGEGRGKIGVGFVGLVRINGGGGMRQDVPWGKFGDGSGDRRLVRINRD